MLKIENTVVPSPEQWEAVIRGLRNPLNSWRLSDSFEAYDCGACGVIAREGSCTPKDHDCYKYRCYSIGPADAKLMSKLRDAGSDHAKYRRMLPVIVDICGPLYWWKEFDQYKIGTTTNSCSTMHKIQEKEFTLDDFSHEHLFIDNRVIVEAEGLRGDFRVINNTQWLMFTCDLLNAMRESYLKTKDKCYWWQMIQLLPSSYNQRRTVSLNYEVLANIYHTRRNHKLDEWAQFRDWIESLPESWIITGKDNEEPSMIFETDKPENNDGK